MGGPTVDEQLAFLRRGTERVVEEEGLRAKLERSLRQRRPLRVKLGIDPTAPDLHLGHAVVLRKLRDFQDLGHQVILVIGDFTGRIGDPTGRSETRRQLTAEDVRRNAETYVQQVRRILDPQRTEVTFNSRWLEPLSFAEVLDLASKVTVARLLERDDFATRYRQGRPIHLHEFFYALMQAYDSVALEADVELGGSDQTFNLMMAREIQRDYGQEPEIAVITPLLVGLDGQQKMSKSLGNAVGISEPAAEMFGKLMSIPDTLIVPYLTLCTRLPVAEVDRLRRGLETGALNPRDVKLRLAEEVVATYHGSAAASGAREEFVARFSRREVPANLAATPWTGPQVTGVVDLLVGLGAATSRSEARRLVLQGAVELDGRRLGDPASAVELHEGTVLRVGKRTLLRLSVAKEGVGAAGSSDRAPTK